MAITNPLTSIGPNVLGKINGYEDMIKKKLSDALSPKAIEARIAQSLNNIESKIDRAIEAKLNKCLSELIPDTSSIDKAVEAAVASKVDEIMKDVYDC